MPNSEPSSTSNQRECPTHASFAWVGHFPNRLAEAGAARRLLSCCQVTGSAKRVPHPSFLCLGGDFRNSLDENSCKSGRSRRRKAPAFLLPSNWFREAGAPPKLPLLGWGFSSTTTWRVASGKAGIARSLFLSGSRESAKRTAYLSPAFQRWERIPTLLPVPVGTASVVPTLRAEACFEATLRTAAAVQTKLEFSSTSERPSYAVPTGLVLPRRPLPAVETAG